MDLQQKLKEQGWYITTEGLNKLPPDVDKCDTRKVVQSLLNIDLRDVGAGALPTELSRKEDSIAGRIVLQIMKIRNIAAPKANEESKVAPRFLYLELTDGVTQVFALEIENILSISLNTPPGTKLYLRSERIPMMQCILTLRPDDVQVLGGEVVALVEKWELSRTLQKYAKGGRMNTGSSGPPPWIPFGQKIQQFNDDKNFKSLSAGSAPEKEKDAKENEFDIMRSEAIAEAAKSGAKKVFGGGNQQMMDHNVKKIIEKGFSEMEAKNALKATKNNLERALYNLKRRDEGHERSENKEIVRGTSKMRPFEKSKKSIGKEETPPMLTKPAGNVSLFDFFTDKLPTNTDTTTSTTTSTTTATSSTATGTTHASSSNKYERHTSRYDSSKSQNSSSNHQYQQEYGGGNSYQSQNSIPNDQQSSSNSNKGMKFENNISSSFANRNTTSNNDGDGVDGNNSYRNRGRNERGERSSRGGGSGGGGSGSYSTRQQSDMGRSGGGGMNYNNNSSQGYNNSNRNQTRPSQERERGPNPQQQQPAYGDNRTNGQRVGNDNRSYKASSSSRYPNNKPSQPNYSQQNNSNSNRNYSENRSYQSADSNKTKELIEDTAKMKIDHRPSNRGGASNRGQRSYSNMQQHIQSHQKPMQQQHQPSAAQQHHPLQQQQHMQVTQQPQMQHSSQQAQPHAVFTQLPNGFAYDPNKIRGFQNKESNEYALSMLKNQTLPAAAAGAAAGAAAMPPPPQNAHPQYPQPPPPMPIPPQQQLFPGPPQFIIQPPQHVRAFGIPTMDGSVFNWKIGDRCLAKYWDDGRFYEAEITGLSDKTCVVLFLGYGNYEEVLKLDCLPVNTNPTIMPHQATGVPPQPQQMQQAVHPVHSQTNTRTAPANAASSSSSRYRGERQMYVPPPKREA